jgi:NDP-sugar pyrophosphorylase family protein
VRDVVLCVGYLGELIEARIGRAQLGISIAYSYDAPGLDGTLGALRKAAPLLGDRFLFLYGDTYLQIDYGEANRSWVRSGRAGLMTVLRNAGQWGESNAEVRDGLVVAYDKRTPTAAMQWIDYGLGGLTADALGLVAPATTDLSDLQSVLAAEGQLGAFEATIRFYEIGTPEALTETDQVLRELAFTDGPGRAVPDPSAPVDLP